MLLSGTTALATKGAIKALGGEGHSAHHSSLGDSGHSHNGLDSGHSHSGIDSGHSVVEGGTFVGGEARGGPFHLYHAASPGVGFHHTAATLVQPPIIHMPPSFDHGQPLPHVPSHPHPVPTPPPVEPPSHGYGPPVTDPRAHLGTPANPFPNWPYVW